ncbi:MAG: cache domain-containing protein, partial [Succinivibrio sp.]
MASVRIIKNNSLVARLGLIIITFVLVSLLVLSFVFYKSSSSIIQKEIVSEQLPSKTALIANNIRSSIEPYVNISKMMANSAYTLDWMKNNEDKEGYHNFLNDRVNLIKEYDLFSTFLASFVSNLYYYKGESRGPLEIDGRDSWLKYTLECKDRYDVNMDYDRVSGNLALFINYKMFNENEKLIGITGTAAKVNNLLDMLKEQRLGNTGYFYCINNSGLLVLHQNKDYILRKNVDEIDPNLLQVINTAVKADNHAT